MREVDIEFLNFLPYKKGVELMRELQKSRLENERLDTILFVQHEEIVTIGPKARNEGLVPPSSYKTINVDRGGGLTWHGPGQLVVYPIFKWDLTGEDSVAAIIDLIEKWVINALEKLGIYSYRDERMQGVWVDDKKICSIGLSFLRWVSRHGFTINYDTPTGRVESIAGCGLQEATTTCLSELNYNIQYEELVEALLESMPESINRKPMTHNKTSNIK